MNCRKIEEDIYVYDMLGADEKKVVDEHISQCKSCAELLIEVQEQQKELAVIRSFQFPPENAAQMTSRIMQATETPIKEDRAENRMLTLLSGFVTLRYALAVVSLLLIASFLYEQTRDVSPLQHPFTNTLAASTSNSPAPLSINKIEAKNTALTKQELSSLRTALEAVKSSDHRQIQFVLNNLAKKNDTRLQRVYASLVKCIDQCREEKREDCTSCQLSYYQNIK